MPKSNAKTKKTALRPAKKESAKPKKALAKATGIKSKKEKAKTPKSPGAKALKAPTTPALRGRSSFKREATKKLLNAKAKILQEVSQKIRHESDNLKFEIGDIYDLASNERERELTLMLGDRDREKLSEIDEALERLKDNSYGICEECGEPVAEDRLRALPFTRVCVECQSKNERELRIKGRLYEEDTGLGIMERAEDERAEEEEEF